MTMMIPLSVLSLLMLLVGPITAPAPLVQQKPSRRHANNNIAVPNRVIFKNLIPDQDQKADEVMLRTNDKKLAEQETKPEAAKNIAFVNKNKVEYDRAMGFQKSVFKTWNAEAWDFQLTGERVELELVAHPVDIHNQTATRTNFQPKRSITSPPMAPIVPPPQPATFQLGSLRIMTDSNSPGLNMFGDTAVAPPPPPQDVVPPPPSGEAPAPPPPDPPPTEQKESTVTSSSYTGTSSSYITGSSSYDGSGTTSSSSVPPPPPPPPPVVEESDSHSESGSSSGSGSESGSDSS